MRLRILMILGALITFLGAFFSAAPAQAATVGNSIDSCPIKSSTSLYDLGYCDDYWENAGPGTPIRIQGQQFHYTDNTDAPQMVRLDSTDGKAREWRFYCYNGQTGTSSAQKWHVWAYHVVQSDVPQYACGRYKSSGILITAEGAACGTTYITNTFIGSVPQFAGSGGNYHFSAAAPYRKC